jgi:hypothetical protein
MDSKQAELTDRRAGLIEADRSAAQARDASRKAAAPSRPGPPPIPPAGGARPVTDVAPTGRRDGGPEEL